MILQLAEEDMRILREKARSSYPKEVCGLFFGDIDGDNLIVRRITTVKNILESPTRFRIDPEEISEALYEAEKEGMQLIGFFHSHPAPAYPSPIDAEYMKLWPENIWLIISSIDHKMAGYQAVKRQLRRVDMEVIDRNQILAW